MNPILIDLETTGLNITRARIVQIGIIYKNKDYNILINPEIDIPEDSSRIHGIKNEDVIGKSTFKEISSTLLKMINECDCLIGYNIKSYDWNILFIEFLRCGIELPNKELIDVYLMIKDIEYSKKLKDVYARLLGTKSVNDHDALSDIKNTKSVYDFIIKKYY